MIKMGLFTAPEPGTSFGVQAPIIQINQYPLWGEYVALALYFTGDSRYANGHNRFNGSNWKV